MRNFAPSKISRYTVYCMCTLCMYLLKRYNFLPWHCCCVFKWFYCARICKHHILTLMMKYACVISLSTTLFACCFHSFLLISLPFPASHFPPSLFLLLLLPSSVNSCTVLGDMLCQTLQICQAHRISMTPPSTLTHLLAMLSRQQLPTAALGQNKKKRLSGDIKGK